MKSHFQMLAAYSGWANDRLFDAVARLPHEDYRAERGAAHGSLHGVLNRALASDRMWMQRLAGDVTAPIDPDRILYEDPAALRVARRAEDERIILFVNALPEAIDPSTPAQTSPTEPAGGASLVDLLFHLFTSQTHHRGQAHGLLEMVRGAAVPSFDLLVFQRETMTSRKVPIGDASRPSGAPRGC